MKKVHIMTFGCQMNEHDTEQIAGLLGAIGYVRTDAPEEADMILLNTCSIREKAEHKLYSQLGHLRPLKEQNPALVLGVCGCVAQQEAAKIFKRVPFVDLVLGTKAIPKLPMLVQNLETRPRVMDVSDAAWSDESDYIARERRFNAFITIIRGCDNYCSYCVVPYTRGREESRQSADILKEARALVADGVIEITLLGQNVSSYRDGEHGKSSFPRLLRLLNDVDGLKRIRFITAHPKDLTDELIETMAELPNICEHFHLPVQSGSSHVLRLMNRKYDRDWYLNRIAALRRAMPGIAITTDFIVGFPGEREEDFQDTLSLLREVRYDAIFGFEYSTRPNARSGNFPDQIAKEVKVERLQQVFAVQRGISLDIHAGMVGKTFEVLIESANPRFPGTLTGRTRHNHAVTFAGREEMVGSLAFAKITEAHPYRLAGELIA